MLTGFCPIEPPAQASDIESLGVHQPSGPEVPTLLIGISTDLLYPPAEMETIAAQMPDAELAVLEAPQGHDAFLIEQEAINRLVTNFRCRRRLPYRLSACGG